MCLRNESVFAREITAAGFERVDSPAGPEMKENFFLVFKRVEKPPAVVD